MTKLKFPVAAWAVLVVTFCVSGIASTQETVSARGAQLLAPMKVELQGALTAGMQRGPLNAISVCKDQAPTIADSLSIEGIQIGRTTHRLRSPANSAPDWVDPILKAYLDDDSDRAGRCSSDRDDVPAGRGHGI